MKKVNKKESKKMIVLSHEELVGANGGYFPCPERFDPFNPRCPKKSIMDLLKDIIIIN